MNVTIYPSHLRGTVIPPSSKSQTHRLLLAAALAEGQSTIGNVSFSQDVEATLRCAEALGAAWERTGEREVRVTGTAGAVRAGRELPRFDCGESGTTLRLVMPLAMALRGGGIFAGRGRLLRRPMGPYREAFTGRGAAWEEGPEAITVRGELEPGEYRLPGNVSSQFFSGLMMALPLLEGESRLTAETPLESVGYLNMTREVLEMAGVAVSFEAGSYRLPGGQRYQAGDRTVEGDWSQAAFWYAANALGSDLKLEGLNPLSMQGDLMIVPHYTHLRRPGDLDIDVSDCPDLVPPLAAMASVRPGTVRLVKAGRLRGKESDRLRTVSQALNALGADVEEGADSLTIRGVPALKGGAVDPCGDHRIAMMAAVAALASDGPVTVLGAECVKKSYPEFWEDYQGLGGEIHVL